MSTIKNLEKRVDLIEKRNNETVDFSEKALQFIKFSIWFFLGMLTVAGFLFFYFWGESLKDLKDEAKKKIQEVQNEEIAKEYKAEAERIIEKLEADIKDQLSYESLFNKKRFYTQNGKDEEAIKIGEKIIEEFPESAFAYYDQAVAYFIYQDISDEKKEEKVRSYLGKAVELDEDNSFIGEYLEVGGFLYEYKEKDWYKKLLKQYD